MLSSPVWVGVKVPVDTLNASPKLMSAEENGNVSVLFMAREDDVAVA